MSLVLYGVMLFAEGRLYWGRLYVLGLSELAAAVLLMNMVRIAPLVYGLWHATVLVVIARHLYRVAGGYDKWTAPDSKPGTGGKPRARVSAPGKITGGAS